VIGAEDLGAPGAAGAEAADDVIVGEVDVEEVVVAAGVGDFFHIVEVLDDGDGAFEAEVVDGDQSALAGAGGEAAGGLGGRRLAGEGDVDAEIAELETEVEGGFGGTGPLPVPEQVKNAHGIARL